VSKVLERLEEVLDLVVAEDRAVGADVLVADVAAAALAEAALHLAFERGDDLFGRKAELLQLLEDKTDGCVERQSSDRVCSTSQRRWVLGG